MNKKKTVYAVLFTLCLAGLASGGVIYQDDFEGATGIQSIDLSTPEVGDPISIFGTGVSFGNGPDGTGKLFRTTTGNNISVSLPDPVTAEKITVTAVIGTSTSTTLHTQLGLQDVPGNFPATTGGVGSAPWIRIVNGNVLAWGGVAINNSITTASGVYTAGDEITAVWTFDRSTAEMSLVIDTTTVWDKVVMTSTDGTFGLNYVTMQFGEAYNTTTGVGMYMEDLKIEVIPEPATLGMLGFSAGLLLLFRRFFL